MKKWVTIVTGILLFWFMLVITGFSLGPSIFVVSALTDEPIDILFFVLFVVCYIVFIWKDKVGKYILLVFLFGWSCMQYEKYFMSSERIQSYNEYFLREGTHRIFPVSDSFLVKDTYHLCLDIFILAALVCLLIFIAKDRKNHRGT